MAVTLSGAYQHEIDSHHDNTLRILMKVGEDKPLPDTLQRYYWSFRRLADRVGYQINDGDLIRFVLAVKMEPGVDRPYSFLDVVREGKVEFDDPVEAKWREGKWVPGTFKGWRGLNEVMVVLDDGTAEVRLFDKADVRLKEEGQSNG